ncbi:MAG: PAS domain-containing protein [Aliidiomarina sp.]|uniref:PAS domain-containing protein n=1 Tax=Aliidiomarina sp. TaxID=1872439 RepID=UPI0025B80729|nr:PAS domain-containing protein [Aliidiomarina sp.]MCH8500756.1 PAS domain-containing protein [Aliidiomarina sp.]
MQNQSHFMTASQSHILNILHNSEIGLWEWDMQNDINQINERWAAMIGYTVAELSPLTFTRFQSLIHHDDVAIVGAALDAKKAVPEHLFSCVFRMRHKHGHWVWVKARGDYSRFEGDQPVAMAGVHFEVTELMGKIELDRVVYQQLDELMAGTRVAFYAFEPTPPFHVSYVSPNLTAEFGLSMHTGEINRDWQERLHPDEREYVIAEFRQFMASKTRTDLIRTFRMQNNEGVYQYIEDHCHKVFENGKLVRVVGSAQNVQEFMDKDRLLKRIADVALGLLYKFVQRPDGTISFPFVNKSIFEIYGVTAEEVTEDATSVFNTIHPDDVQHVADSIEQSAKTLKPWDCEYRVIRENDTIWVRGQSVPELEADGSIAWYGLIMDITEAKKTEQQLRDYQMQLERVQEIAKLGHWRADMATGELFWSDIIYDIFGFDKSEITPSVQLFSSCVHPEDIEAVRESERVAMETGLHDVQHRIIRPDGEVRWVHELADFTQTDGKGKYLTGTVRDITETKLLELELRNLSDTDALTQVDNRRSFFLKALPIFNRQSRTQLPVSVIMFDIDHFKHVNDQYGHAAGDQVLVKVSRAVRNRLRGMDVLARLGGEEFIVLTEGISLSQAANVAEQLREVIGGLNIQLDRDRHFSVTASFGVAERLTDESVDELLNRADKAMYRAKQQGRNQVVVAE